MKPLATLPNAVARGLEGLVLDLDDTFLTHGVLTRQAYDAMWQLADAGMRLVVATGRPSAWGEVLVRQWPVAAVVAENGAVALVREGSGVARRDGVPEAMRRSRRVRLAQLVEDARSVVPEARLTDDVEGRFTDVTWDIGERQRLPAERVALLAATVRAAGARVFQSSVHLHATFDGADKATGVLAFLASLGRDPAVARLRYAFVGDSGNDAAAFSAFETTFAVANVARYLAAFTIPPRYVTRGAMGEGFAELAEALVGARRAN